MKSATRLILVAALALAAGTPALAAPAAWVVDHANSKLGFKSSFAGDAVDGIFHRWDATIAFDPADLAHSSASVTVDVASGQTGDGSRDESLPGDDWFAAAKFPKATFITKGFRSLGGNRYAAAGDLTIRGVTKAIDLPFTLDISGDTAKMASSISLNRTLFGVGQGEFKTGESVPVDVTVNVSLTAHKK